MPLTPRGLIYPVEADHTRLWEHLQNLADSADDAIGDIDTTLVGYSSYAPTWSAATTNPTLGNGTLAGLYRQVNKEVHFLIRLLIGSTTTVGSGGYSWSLPVAAASAFDPIAWGLLFDASASLSLPRIGFTTTGTTMALHDMAGVRASGSAPFAVAVNDRFYIGGKYQAA